MPSSFSIWRVDSSAAFGGRVRLSDPLSSTALWKSPRARGIVRRQAMFTEPADSPKTVTLCGSPPKAAISSRTHSSAATTSSMPSLPVLSSPPPSSLPRRKPKGPRR